VQREEHFSLLIIHLLQPVKDLASVPADYTTDLYMWLNYVIFEVTAAGTDDNGDDDFAEGGTIVEDVFRNALLRLTNVEHRKRIWMEYLVWAKNERAEEDIQRIVDEALLDIPTDVTVPISTHEPSYTVNPSYKHLVLPFPFKDYEFHNSIVDQYLAYIPRIRWRFVLEKAVSLFHNDNLVLSLRAAEYEEMIGNYSRARGYLEAAVKNPPFGSDVESCWIKLVEIVVSSSLNSSGGEDDNDDDNDNVVEARTIFERAVAALPTSAKLWRSYLHFERAHGGSSGQVNRIVQQIAEKGVQQQE